MGFLNVFIVLMFAAAVSVDGLLNGGPRNLKYGRIFTLKSKDYRYGYVRRYGYYYADKKDLLQFTPALYGGRFRFLSNGAIQEVYSYKCFNLFTPTNQQLVLTSKCSGLGVATWGYYRPRQWLINKQTGKCLSPWNYQSHTPRPATVLYVPGLDECTEYNKIIMI